MARFVCMDVNFHFFVEWLTDGQTDRQNGLYNSAL